MMILKRVSELRQRMEEHKIDAFIIPRADEHQNEYLASSDERVRYISGFTGSAATVIISKNKAALFTDGRYTIQAKRQLDESIFHLCHSVDHPMNVWILKNLSDKITIGFDPKLHTTKQIENLNKDLSSKNIAVTPSVNFVDLIWTDQPPTPQKKVFIHHMKYSGESSSNKRSHIKKILKENKIDAILISSPENLCWTFNLRGSDVPMTPIAFGYAIIDNKGNAKLFFHKNKLNGQVRTALTQDKTLSINDISEFLEQIKHLAGKKIWLDSQTANVEVLRVAEEVHVSTHISTDPIYLMKAKKNAVELKGIQAAHLRDSTAIIKFIKWFMQTDPSKIDEWKAAKRIESERKKLDLFQEVSFPTISATGPNAAEAHYQLTKKTAKPLSNGDLFLFDSGGQFLDGTTDITRVLAVGKPTEEMIHCYTLVLKGHIAIHMAKFPEGTTGQQLDPLARQFLWSEGKDFDHGTGHGVGHYLSVHEGPQRISKTSTIPLEVGMVLSNEPGFYKTGCFGIRIENLMTVKLIKSAKETKQKSLFGFDILSFVPYDVRLIDKNILSQKEINWINDYHREVKKRISPLLDSKTKDFLISITPDI